MSQILIVKKTRIFFMVCLNFLNKPLFRCAKRPGHGMRMSKHRERFTLKRYILVRLIHWGNIAVAWHAWLTVNILSGNANMCGNAIYYQPSPQGLPLTMLFYTRYGQYSNICQNWGFSNFEVSKLLKSLLAWPLNKFRSFGLYFLIGAIFKKML